MSPDEATARPDEFDESLWVTASGYDGRLLLGFNPHVHVGRIGVWSDALKMGTRISAGDVTYGSPGARAWIDGFLAGNEPGPSHMFGPLVHDLPDDHPKWERWRAAVASFRATGSVDRGELGDLSPIDPEATLPHAAWNRRGDEQWNWTRGEWGQRCPNRTGRAPSHPTPRAPSDDITPSLGSMTATCNARTAATPSKSSPIRQGRTAFSISSTRTCWTSCEHRTACAHWDSMTVSWPRLPTPSRPNSVHAFEVTGRFPSRPK